jgi:F0F1-type ATP synthase membrane subunit b/b'
LHTHLTYEDRTKRVKDARSEAQKEIEEYKKEKEAEYQKFEKEVCMSLWDGSMKEDIEG